MELQSKIICSGLLLLLGWQVTFAVEKTYHKTYFPDGQLKAEGWLTNQLKTDFWIYYHPNGKVAAKGHYQEDTMHGYWHFYYAQGQLKKEGHFVWGSIENWWIFYELGSRKKSKFQYKNNQKNGYCLRYVGNKLVLAEKYIADKKVGEWSSVREFKKDNPDISFR